MKLLSSMTDDLRFIRTASQGFSKTGTIFRSSSMTAKRLAKLIPQEAECIVEYGAGDGVISKSILSQMSPIGRLFAIEILNDFIPGLRRIQDPRFEPVHGSAIELSSKLTELCGKGPDVVISGIPFSFLSPKDRNTIVSRTADQLQTNGTMIVYQVTPKIVPLLKRYFAKVTVQLEFRNIPPYFIMVATK